jgi:hypothetical protein
MGYVTLIENALARQQSETAKAPSVQTSQLGLWGTSSTSRSENKGDQFTPPKFR